MKMRKLAVSSLVATLLFVAHSHAQSTPAVGPYGSIWVNDGNQIGRFDFTSPTAATFTALPVLQFGDFSKAGINIMTDIAWAPDYSAMYAVTRHDMGDDFFLQGLSQFDPNTGLGLVLSNNNNIGQVNRTVANGAGFVNGALYTAVDDITELFQINITTGVYTEIGTVTAGGTDYYGAGDIVFYNGAAYSLSLTDPSGAGVNNYLVRLDVDDPSNSTLMGLVGTGSDTFTNGFGIAAIDGVGLYAVGNGKELFLLDPDNPGSLTAVTITGDTSAFSVFNGATAAPVPEPSAFALLGGCLGLWMWKRKRGS